MTSLGCTTTCISDTVWIFWLSKDLKRCLKACLGCSQFRGHSTKICFTAVEWLFTSVLWIDKSLFCVSIDAEAPAYISLYEKNGYTSHRSINLHRLPYWNLCVRKLMWLSVSFVASSLFFRFWIFRMALQTLHTVNSLQFYSSDPSKT